MHRTRDVSRLGTILWTPVDIVAPDVTFVHGLVLIGFFFRLTFSLPYSGRKVDRGYPRRS